MALNTLDFFPIGHVIETIDNSFNPNTSIGGTWELNHGGNSYVMVSKDSNDTDFSTVGQTGGSSTASVAIGNYPSHTHTCRGGFLIPGNHGAGDTYGSLKVNGSWWLWSGYVDNGGSYDGYGWGYINFPNQANATGSAHNNMCAYRVVNRWIRTA